MRTADAGVVGNDVDDEEQARGFQRVRKPIEALEAPEFRVDRVMVDDVIAVHRTGLRSLKRRQVDVADAELGEIGRIARALSKSKPRCICKPICRMREGAATRDPVLPKSTDLGSGIAAPDKPEEKIAGRAASTPECCALKLTCPSGRTRARCGRVPIELIRTTPREVSSSDFGGIRGFRCGAVIKPIERPARESRNLFRGAPLKGLRAALCRGLPKCGFDLCRNRFT